MTKDSRGAPGPTGRSDSARRSLRPALTTLWLGLFTLSAQPVGPLTNSLDKVARRLLVGGAVLIVLLTAGTCTSLIMDASHLPYGMAIVLGLAQTTPVLLALTRPVTAWWISLTAAVVIALLTTPTEGGAWPWTQAGLVAYLAVLLMLAWSATPLATAVVWGGTVLTGYLLALLAGHLSSSRDLPLVAVLSACGLGLVAGLRGRSEARRELKHQEVLTEAERSRNALLEERARIARELHDVVAHHMSVIAVQAEAAPYRVDEPPQELTDSFATIRENALTALNELRHLLGMLRSEEAGAGDTTPDRGPQPTMADIEQLVENVRSAGSAVELTVEGAARTLPPGVGLSVFRIVQEALSNALRHAPGSPVSVDIDYRGEGIHVRVVNGPSTETAARPALKRSGSGHGVLGMRERAAMLGGTLRAGPGPDGQFEVVALLPIGEGADV
ncbi:sensor histidine kinase [Streptomyces sp. NBC_00057]|uniref:sensor histidine kinase n=1 Tax=Streptomyces sp. NBC_00057 TaxID=2975634 RepID=UPI003253067B